MSEKQKKQTRGARWTAAAGKAQEALQELVELQQEYESWKDNLPENLNDSPVGQKLEEVCGLDLQSALDTAEEAEGLDLPLGFGRD